MWNFDDGDGPVKQSTAACDQEVKLRVRSGRTTVATVDIPLGDGTAQRIATEIAVRDVLIAGLGDFDRRRRRQSRQSGGARRRLLLQALPARRRQSIFPPEPRRLYRRPVLRERAVEQRCGKRLGAAWRALDESGLPSLALQLSGAHRAGARRRAAASRRHARSAGLHRSDHRRRHVRRAARRRLPVGGRHRKLFGDGAGSIRRTQERDGGGAPPGSESQYRSDAADGRRQRRELRRTRRQCHRRGDHGTAAAQGRRLERQRRRRAEDARSGFPG